MKEQMFNQESKHSMQRKVAIIQTTFPFDPTRPLPLIVSPDALSSKLHNRGWVFLVNFTEFISVTLSYYPELYLNNNNTTIILL